MLPQFVDFNADGFVDIVTGTYDGSPHVALGSAEGFTKPTHILDRDGNRMILEMYWDHTADTWNMGDEHCTSAAAFDWDADGDFDILLGDYNKGHLAVRINEGTNEKPAFSTNNTPVRVGDEPFAVKGGMSAPQLIDWDGDGLTDILTGGMKEGGVYFYRNTGELGKPAFAPAETIVESDVSLKEKSGPNNGCYPFAHDVDGDGDLDLLVGGYSTWHPDQEPLTDEQKQRLATLKEESDLINAKMMALWQSAEKEANGDDEKQQELIQKIVESDEYQAMSKKMQPVWQEIASLEGQPNRDAGIWFYRRK